MKIGILGGTFDPPHFAHKEIAYRAIDQFNLEKIIFIPNGMPWQKLEISEYSKRFEMTQLLVSGESKFEVSNIENNIYEPTYTVNTLKKLNIKKPDSYYILGADAALGIKTWMSYEKLVNFTNFLIAPRKDVSNLKINIEFPFEFELIEGEYLDISSTVVRELFKKNKILDEIIPQNIINYIKQHQLY